MTLELRTQTFAITLAAVVAVTLLYWGYSAHRKSEVRKVVAELVKDTGRRLQEALAIETGAASADDAQTVRKLDDHAQEVDRYALELRGLGASPNRALVDAADEYILTARQILRNQASSHRYRIQLSASNQALREHMRTAGRRSGAWIERALAAKDRLDRDYFDYRLAVETFVRLLESYPDVRKSLAVQIGSAPFPDDELARQARRRAQESAKRAAQEIERAKQLAAVH